MSKLKRVDRATLLKDRILELTQEIALNKDNNVLALIYINHRTHLLSELKELVHDGAYRCFIELEMEKTSKIFNRFEKEVF
ncbi:MAG: hypothetical protein ABF633_03350 [Clostridium sp.]|uniref:hypothetical protein n=1 Tax=Clostridium sp. TaxID=1506 RepID=UPI0039E950A4